MCENEKATEAQLRELFPDRMSPDEFEATERSVEETIVDFTVLVGELGGAESAEMTTADVHEKLVEMAKGLRELAVFTAALLREVKELPRVKYAPRKPVAQSAPTGPTLDMPVDF